MAGAIRLVFLEPGIVVLSWTGNAESKQQGPASITARARPDAVRSILPIAAIFRGYWPYQFK
jgi:hypothetical protein